MNHCMMLLKCKHHVRVDYHPNLFLLLILALLKSIWTIKHAPPLSAITCRILPFFHLPRHMLFSLKPYLTVTGNKCIFRRALMGARRGFWFQRLQRKRCSCSLSIVFKSHLGNASQSVWLSHEHINKRYVVACKKTENNKISAKLKLTSVLFKYVLSMIITRSSLGSWENIAFIASAFKESAIWLSYLLLLNSCHTLSALKQQTFIISWFLWVRSLDVT